MSNSFCFILCYSLAVVVEDSSSTCCVTVKVFQQMTTAALKQQVSLKSKPCLLSCYSIIILPVNTVFLSFTDILICTSFSITFSDVSRVRLSPMGSAMGDWPVPVHWPAHSGLIWCSAGWWHSFLVPPVSTSCSLDAPSPPAGPGERPSPQSYITVAPHPSTHCYLCKQLHTSGPETLHHSAS